jgi:hypothetical protein
MLTSLLQLSSHIRVLVLQRLSVRLFLRNVSLNLANLGVQFLILPGELGVRLVVAVQVVDALGEDYRLIT